MSFLNAPLSRRDFLRSGSQVGLLTLLAACQPARPKIPPELLQHAPAFDFTEVPQGLGAEMLAPKGHHITLLAQVPARETAIVWLPNSKSDQHSELWCGGRRLLLEHDGESWRAASEAFPVFADLSLLAPTPWNTFLAQDVKGALHEFDPRTKNPGLTARRALGGRAFRSLAFTHAPDGRLVVYMTDMTGEGPLYRFVSKNGAQDGNALTAGTYHVAQFQAGGLVWANQMAAATRLEAPGDVRIGANNRLYLALGGKAQNKAKEGIYPTPHGLGTLLELTPPTRAGKLDHAAPRFDWAPMLQGGDPAGNDNAFYLAQVGAQGWLACPSALATSTDGSLWIGTRGMEGAKHAADGLYRMPLDGAWRGRPYHFFRAPQGFRMGAITTADDGRALFFSLRPEAKNQPTRLMVLRREDNALLA